MGACGLRLTVVLLVLAALALPSSAAASRDAGLAALQVALHKRGLYAGSIDGVKGPATTAAIKRLQRRAGLAVDGVAGPRTRQVLGRYGRHALGSRLLARGARGWDVAALQFLLAWHGFPSATIDGVLGFHTDRALRRFQRWAGLGQDGVAGASTFAALRRAPAT
jgi:peptidoglycan hydrolase-like protein with peptidoglycan-binding domain